VGAKYIYMKPFEFELMYIDSVQYKGQKTDYDINITGGEGMETNYDELYLHRSDFDEEELGEITEIIQNKYKEIIEKLWN
jgi:hypothetical protein